MDPKNGSRPLAVVTGASTGIGFELARCCAQSGYDVVIAADDPTIEDAARCLSKYNVTIEPLQVDLSQMEGVDALCQALGDRPVGALLANAGRGLARPFLNQEWNDIIEVLDTNVTGTLYLIHRIGRGMRQCGNGHILITGSIAGFKPGTYQAVYHGTKALLDNFALALRAELKDTGVTVTCLMPGATETEFLERAQPRETRAGETNEQQAEKVAQLAFLAMMRGERDAVSGWNNKLRAAIAHFFPADTFTELAAPGSTAKA